MNAYRMWIGGDWVEAKSGETYTVVNPATEEEIAQVPLGGREEVDRAVQAARGLSDLVEEDTGGALRLHKQDRRRLQGA